jgi:hypothetical protein
LRKRRIKRGPPLMVDLVAILAKACKFPIRIFPGSGSAAIKAMVDIERLVSGHACFTRKLCTFHDLKAPFLPSGISEQFPVRFLRHVCLQRRHVALRQHGKQADVGDLPFGSYPSRAVFAQDSSALTNQRHTCQPNQIQTIAATV